jgi:probable F420-dependent oxidoreductase
MKYGLTMFMTDYTIGVLELARLAENLGFESLFVPEHPIIPVEMTTPFAGNPEGILPDFYKHTVDPFVAMSAAAAVTTKLRVGTAICLVPERDALITASQVASVDFISGGRFEFGIGAGWLREESEIFGVDFPRRWSQTRDHILAMKACWGQHPSEHHGKYVEFPQLWAEPKPVQKPHPPILMAGEGEKVASRIAEYGDGWLPRARALDPAGVEAGRAKIEQALRDAGRDPAALTVSLFGAAVEGTDTTGYGNAGCDRIIFMLPSEDEAKTTARLEKLAGEVM